MRIIADLQLHSKYSRAVSSEMVIPKIAEWAKKKGINLVATGDWTHPLWFREIKAGLEETGSGLLRLKEGRTDEKSGPFFLLATEISSIYSQGGKVRRIHTLVWVPTIAAAEKINTELVRRGANLLSDGRPVVGLSAKDVAEIALTIESSSLVIPAHAWTPWFSLYGSQSGFDSIEECFGGYAKYIYAIETGLSSDPGMNWRIAELDNRSIISFSDAHSGPKIGREATVFRITQNSHLYSAAQDFGGQAKIKNQNQDLKQKKFSYEELTYAIKQDKTGDWEVGYTIEFFPEEGKYHYTGHRLCHVRQSPAETKKRGTTCPVCGKPLTVGVMHRVEELATRPPIVAQVSIDKHTDLRMIGHPASAKPSYVMLVPLLEILAESLGGLPQGEKIKREYERMVANFGSEFAILLDIPTEDIMHFSGPRVAEGIRKVRQGDIVIDPGYDGLFGVVKIWPSSSSGLREDVGENGGQLTLF